MSSLKHALTRKHLRHVNDDADIMDETRFLTPLEAADFLRMSPVTLGRWRIECVGPPHRKFGRCVRYDVVELVAWADAQMRQSTSQGANQSHAEPRDDAWFKQYGWR